MLVALPISEIIYTYFRSLRKYLYAKIPQYDIKNYQQI